MKHSKNTLSKRRAFVFKSTKREQSKFSTDPMTDTISLTATSGIGDIMFPAP